MSGQKGPIYFKYVFDSQTRRIQLLFGLYTAPYLFTKIMKPIVARLREQGFESVIHLDNIFLIGNLFKGCSNNVFQARLS